MSNQEEIIESVQAAKAPGTFNIVQVLQDRGYPKSTVEIYMDEAAMYEMATFAEELQELDNLVAKKSETEKQKALREELLAKRNNSYEKLVASRYFVHLTGISEGKREEFYKQAVKKYPVEYQAQSGISSLLGTDSTKTEKDSPDRDALFTDFLWQGHIEKIVNPDGDEQTEFGYSTIRTMRESFPLNAMVKINEAIEKLRAATAIFTLETGEDFLAKP
jgi:hypothetical protein